MSKIKETITALTSGNSPGGVRVSREEREPMSDERFKMILECVVLVVFIIAWTVLALNAGPEEMILLVALVGIAGIIYAGIKIK